MHETTKALLRMSRRRLSGVAAPILLPEDRAWFEAGCPDVPFVPTEPGWYWWTGDAGPEIWQVRRSAAGILYVGDLLKAYGEVKDDGLWLGPVALFDPSAR